MVNRVNSYGWLWCLVVTVLFVAWSVFCYYGGRDDGLRECSAKMAPAQKPEEETLTPSVSFEIPANRTITLMHSRNGWETIDPVKPMPMADEDVVAGYGKENIDLISSVMEMEKARIKRQEAALKLLEAPK